MDNIAEKGLAAHWKYKEGAQAGSEPLDKMVNWVRDVLENPRPDHVGFCKRFSTQFISRRDLRFYSQWGVKNTPE